MKKTIVLVLVLILTAFVPAALSEQITLTFQEGVNGYNGTSDTFLDESYPNDSFGNETYVAVDGDGLPGLGCASADGILRFDGIFGSLPNNIPLGSSIVSATLTLNVITNESGDGASVHRLLVDWDETATWNNSFGGNGVDLGTEAVQNEDAISGLGPGIYLGELTINVTASVQAWSDGDENHGWAILLDPDAYDGWRFASSENAVVSVHPNLSVTIPEPATLSLLVLGGLAMLRRRRW